jgi:hypothetical protein
MPVWLVEIVSKSPVLAGVAVVAYFAYKTVKHLVDSPLSVVTIIGVFGNRERRQDALELAKVLRSEGQRQPSFERPPAHDPNLRGYRRRKRRQQLRSHAPEPPR